MMVSILVPVYNSAPFLRECVASLVGQTYTDLQIVMIDDGSTDESLDIMRELAHQDKRIEIYSKPNGGVASTRNQLLDKVRGDWVLFVDSDDWIDLNTVEVLLKEQAEGDHDIVCYKHKGPSSERKICYNQEQAIRHFLEHTFFRGSLWNKLIRSSLFDKLQFDENVSYGEDALMVWNVLQRVKSVCLLDKAMYHYRVNSNSLSRQTFNGKKFTEHIVWDSICSDTDELWPQYSDIAHARFACEMTQVLKSAAASDYRHDSCISLLQEEVRRDGHLISQTGISSRKMSMFAWLVSRNYWLARFVAKRV